jgi:hypothetical protein
MVDTLRLFLTSRGEGSLVHIVDAQLSPTLALSCHGDAASRDCRGSALSLAEDFPSERSVGPVSAPLPFGVAVGGSTVFVTHLAPVENPPGSGLNPEGFLVHFPAGEPPARSAIRDPRYFTSIGATTAHAVASDGQFAFFTGRPNRFNPQAVLLRWWLNTEEETLSDTQKEPVPTGAMLENFYRAVETRGIAVSKDLNPAPELDERRLFIAGRTPDTLLVLKLTVPTDSSGKATGSPQFFLERAVSLPQGPNELAVIERDNKRPVVAISCENFLTGQDADLGEVVFYDDEVGQLVARVRVGSQPFGLAVDRRSASARIFAANFGDGQIAVIDMPNVDAPQGVKVVAHLGLPHVCLDSPSDSKCQEAQ